MIVQPVYERLNTNTFLLPSLPNFNSQPCKASNSMPPGPVISESFRGTNYTISSVICTGRKPGVSLYDSNVEQWGFCSGGWRLRGWLGVERRCLAIFREGSVQDLFFACALRRVKLMNWGEKNSWWVQIDKIFNEHLIKVSDLFNDGQ